MKRELLRQMTTRTDRFSLPLSRQDAFVLLSAAYQAEVEQRYMAFKNDEHTNANISLMAGFLTGGSSKFGIALLGLYGCGKTTILLALQRAINYLNDRGCFRNQNVGMRIIDARCVVTRQKDTREYERIRNERVLAIDDVGREAAQVLDFGNVLSPVADLIEYRYERQLFTLLSTNLTKNELRIRYGARVADRLNEMMECIFFKSDASYRK